MKTDPKNGAPLAVRFFVTARSGCGDFVEGRALKGVAGIGCWCYGDANVKRELGYGG